jgi:hypothetical protein
MNQSRSWVTIVGLGILALSVATSAGCENRSLGKLLRSQVTVCPSDQCSSPAPIGEILVCDELSTAGPECIQTSNGVCDWAMLSCPEKVSSFVKPGTQVGVCVLEYNSALVAQGADPCCAWVGGPNNCDANVACNGTSGSNCCLIYATDATVGNMGCCLYENGSTPTTGPGADRREECGGLLAGP